MTTLEILLLLLGVIIFIASFVMPETQSEIEAVDKQLTKEQIQEMLKEEMKHVHEQVNDVIDETVSYSVEKSERALERLTNDKIHAISEYSGTVLEDIHKNHEETMFLYDMLNDKHENLKEVASEVSQAVKQANEAVLEVQNTSQQVKVVVDEAIMAAAEETIEPAKPNEEVFSVFEPILVTQIDHVSQEDVLGQPDKVDLAPVEGDIEDVDLLREVLKPVKSASTDQSASAGKKEVAKKPSARSAAKKNTKKKTIANDIAIHFDGAKESENNNDLILQLHNQGKSNMAIAKQLGLGVGEVNLVIALFEENGL